MQIYFLCANLRNNEVYESNLNCIVFFEYFDILSQLDHHYAGW